MMDVREFLARLWAAVVAVFFGAFVLSLANTAHARVFPECNPAAEAGKLYGAADADAWVTRICGACPPVQLSADPSGASTRQRAHLGRSLDERDEDDRSICG